MFKRQHFLLCIFLVNISSCQAWSSSSIWHLKQDEVTKFPVISSHPATVYGTTFYNSTTRILLPADEEISPGKCLIRITLEMDVCYFLEFEVSDDSEIIIIGVRVDVRGIASVQSLKVFKLVKGKPVSTFSGRITRGSRYFDFAREYAVKAFRAFYSKYLEPIPDRNPLSSWSNP